MAQNDLYTGLAYYRISLDRAAFTFSKFVLISCFLLPITSLAEKGTLYKIINASGNIELKSKISPEEAKRGYTIITNSGHTVKEVLPELSEQEYNALSSEKRKALEAEQRIQQEGAYNESLLLRYSNIEDLNAEWKRKLQEFDIRISILKNNQAALRKKAEQQQASAADLERRNISVPELLEQNILALEAEMKETNTEIKFRYKEKGSIDEQYANDAERLTSLLNPWAKKNSSSEPSSRAADESSEPISQNNF